MNNLTRTLSKFLVICISIALFFVLVNQFIAIALIFTSISHYITIIDFCWIFISGIGSCLFLYWLGFFKTSEKERNNFLTKEANRKFWFWLAFLLATEIIYLLVFTIVIVQFK